MSQSVRWRGLGLPGVLILGACASAPTARPQLAETQSAIRAADEVGAKDQSEARLHLKLAKENLARGRELIEKDEQERARAHLQRAEIDAELAIALVREERSRAEAQGVRQELAELDKKLNQEQE